MRRLVELQIAHGVHGLWVLGTSGEFASLTRDERAAICTTAVEQTNGRVPVIVNVSEASTRGAIACARDAALAGADAIAATPPYYYPHSQDELLTHYRRLRTAVDLPLFLYNIPQTVKVPIALATAGQLAEEGTAAGIKDSQNDFEWFRQLTAFLAGSGIDFHAFAGTRSLIDAALLAGAAGAIPSIANAFPWLAVEAYDATVAGAFQRAADCERAIIRLEAIPLARTVGSRNAALLGFQKTVLHDRGVISSPALAEPLRSFTTQERGELLQALRAVPEALAPLHS